MNIVTNSSSDTNQSSGYANSRPSINEQFRTNINNVWQNKKQPKSWQSSHNFVRHFNTIKKWRTSCSSNYIMTVNTTDNEEQLTFPGWRCSRPVALEHRCSVTCHSQKSTLSTPTHWTGSATAQIKQRTESLTSQLSHFTTRAVSVECWSTAEWNFCCALLW